jgi:NAD+ synthase
MNSLEKGTNPKEFNSEMKEKYTIYKKHHLANKHKMISIPVCKIPNELKS